MPVKKCGWFGCSKSAEKHVIFAVRVHEAAVSGQNLARVEVAPNRFDLCRAHVAHVERNYMQVQINDLLPAVRRDSR